ncbi:MAG: hypothetical protein IPP90_04620 [Gemmatimonadaceae bacterium]|nr:hypothetical protein [Gemmatimonadaceae bacterium]
MSAERSSDRRHNDSGENMATIVQRVAGQIGQRSVLAALMLGLVPAGVALAKTPAESDCATSVTVARVAGQVAAASLVTGLEYRDMTRQGGWHMAQESDRAAVAADPSSHLHALGSYHMARNLGSTQCTSSAAMRRAALRGAALSLAIGTAKEVSDARYNGFSPTDLAVDVVGAGYAVAQAYVPALRHVTPSFSVAPRAFVSKGGPTAALTDYANQTLWLSANVHELLPTSVSRAWPSAVRLSMGRRAYGGGAPSDFVLGLDLDAAQLPGSHPAWVRIKQVMHNVRLPGPALVMGANGTRTVGLYW